MTKSRSLSSLAFFVHHKILLVHIFCKLLFPSSVMLKHLYIALEQFAMPQKNQLPVLHVAVMHVHRLAQVWNAINYY